MGTAEISDASPRTPPAMRIMLGLLTSAVAAAVVLGGAYSLLDVAARHTSHLRASYAGVRALIVDDDNGDVRLTGAPAGSALVVHEQVTQGLATPQHRAVRERGGVLALSSSCDDLLGPECNVAYSIVVPSGISVTAGSGAGDISARDRSGAGDVSASRVSAADVRLSSGAGDIRADLRGNLHRLVASSGAGDVTLTVPNAVYHVNATSGAGSVSDQGLRQDPASPRTITASSGAGDVTIDVAR